MSEVSILPVDPRLTDDGAIASLVPLLGEENSKPIALEEGDDPFRTFNVTERIISVEAGGSLKVASIFGGEVGANDQGLYLDAGAWTTKYRTGNLGEKELFATRWGVGIRVALRVRGFSGKGKVSFTVIAASAEVEKISVDYEIIGLGLGLDGLLITLDKLRSIGQFNFEVYYKVTHELSKALAKHIKANRDQMVPQPIAVGLMRPVSVNPVSQSRSVIWALNRIVKKRALDQALAEVGPDVDQTLVARTYRETVGDVPGGDEPSDSARDRAKEWLTG